LSTSKNDARGGGRLLAGKSRALYPDPGELVTKKNNNVQKWIDIEKEAGLIK
jgi:hypothetical protein